MDAVFSYAFCVSCLTSFVALALSTNPRSWPSWVVSFTNAIIFDLISICLSSLLDNIRCLGSLHIRFSRALSWGQLRRFAPYHPPYRAHYPPLLRKSLTGSDNVNFGCACAACGLAKRGPFRCRQTIWLSEIHVEIVGLYRGRRRRIDDVIHCLLKGRKPPPQLRPV